MNSIFRITTAVNKVSPMNPQICCENILDILCGEEALQSDIIVFPSLALCSPSSGNLLEHPLLADLCQKQLAVICEQTRHLNAYLIVGLVIRTEDENIPVLAVIREGLVLGYLPQNEDTPLFEGILPSDSLFQCGELRFTVCPAPLEELPVLLPSVCESGCDLVLVPSYTPVKAGMIDRTVRSVEALSNGLGVAVAVCNGGVCDTSHPYCYEGFGLICEGEQATLLKKDSFDNIVVSYDIDLDILHSTKKRKYSLSPTFAFPKNPQRLGLKREILPDPYLPKDAKKASAYLDELFELQVSALMSRMQNTGLHKLVLGISGGLDSTLAALVAYEALRRLEFPSENLIGITMPGFGTTDRTYYNALSLLDGLGADRRDISIKAAVLQHFEDIGHNFAVKDITYENAQARERSQILFDIANASRGIVVGTGDLSEAALGWCTFGGDQLSGYNVNICLTKSLIRNVVSHIVREGRIPQVSDILTDILDTPISPELLPPDEQGKIAQKTEDILGPYELHDFFLYYFIRHHFSPKKIYTYACIAFAKTLEPSYIKEKLGLFLKRFFSGQFKRSCSPDSAIITDIHLSGAAFYIPSDCSPEALLDALSHLEE